MNHFKRQLVLVTLMLMIMGAVAYWSVEWMLQQRQAVAVAAQDLAACQALAGDIAAVSRRPAVALTAEVGVYELGQRIEAASQKAQFAPAALEGVFPQAARRVGGSPYLHKPTALALRGVSLLQLTTFLYHLTDQSGWTVQDLRLRSPRGDDGGAQGGLWDAEASVTCLIYAPPAH